MNKNFIDDKARINNMIKNIDFCIENTKDISENEYTANIKTQYALNMALQIICENANQITEEIKKLSPNTKWKEMRTTRNIISHEYGLIMLDALYDTLIDDLPQLKKELENILSYNELLEKYNFYTHNSDLGKKELEDATKGKPIENKINIINNMIKKFEPTETNLTNRNTLKQ